MNKNIRFFPIFLGIIFLFVGFFPIIFDNYLNSKAIHTIGVVTSYEKHICGDYDAPSREELLPRVSYKLLDSSQSYTFLGLCKNRLSILNESPLFPVNSTVELRILKHPIFPFTIVAMPNDRLGDRIMLSEYNNSVTFILAAVILFIFFIPERLLNKIPFNNAKDIKD